MFCGCVHLEPWALSRGAQNALQTGLGLERGLLCAVSALRLARAYHLWPLHCRAAGLLAVYCLGAG